MMPFNFLQLPVDHRTVASFAKTRPTALNGSRYWACCGLEHMELVAEHVPHGRQTMDCRVLAARAAELPMPVRVPDHRDAAILSVLDLVGHGLVVQHVNSAADVANVVAAVRFIGGRRECVRGRDRATLEQLVRLHG